MAKGQVVLSSRKYTDMQIRHERKMRKQTERSRDERFSTFLKGNEEHLKRLNGEGDRIRDILSASVTSEKFNDYTTAQRDKVDAAERASREHFEGYSKSIELRLSQINKQIARWSGGIAAVIIALELWLKYGGK